MWGTLILYCIARKLSQIPFYLSLFYPLVQTFQINFVTTLGLNLVIEASLIFLFISSHLPFYLLSSSFLSPLIFRFISSHLPFHLLSSSVLSPLIFPLSFSHFPSLLSFQNHLLPIIFDYPPSPSTPYFLY